MIHSWAPTRDSPPLFSILFSRSVKQTEVRPCWKVGPHLMTAGLQPSVTTWHLCFERCINNIKLWLMALRLWPRPRDGGWSGLTGRGWRGSITLAHRGPVSAGLSVKAVCSSNTWAWEDVSALTNEADIRPLSPRWRTTSTFGSHLHKHLFVTFCVRFWGVSWVFFFFCAVLGEFSGV